MRSRDAPNDCIGCGKPAPRIRERTSYRYRWTCSVECRSEVVQLKNIERVIDASSVPSSSARLWVLVSISR